MLSILSLVSRLFGIFGAKTAPVVRKNKPFGFETLEDRAVPAIDFTLGSSSWITSEPYHTSETSTEGPHLGTTVSVLEERDGVTTTSNVTERAVYEVGQVFVRASVITDGIKQEYENVTITTATTSTPFGTMVVTTNEVEGGVSNFTQTKHKFKESTPNAIVEYGWTDSVHTDEWYTRTSTSITKYDQCGNVLYFNEYVTSDSGDYSETWTQDEYYNETSLVPPTLYVAQKSLGTEDVVVENQKNVVALAGELYSQNGNSLTTSITVSAQQGNLQDGSRYMFVIDTDGDNLVDSVDQTAVATNGRVNFDTAVLASNGESKRFEVWVDIASSLSGDKLQLKLDSITAENAADGSELAANHIVVTPTDSVVLNLVEIGNLTVLKDSTPVRSRDLLGGQLSDVVLRLQFHAENEPIDITDLRFTLTGPGYKAVDRIELFKVGATTPFALATPGGMGNEPFSPANGVGMQANMESRQLVNGKYTDEDILVRLRMKPDTDGYFPGDVTVALNGNGKPSVEFRGDISSNSGSLSNVIVGNTNRVVYSKITSITNANPETNGASASGITPIGQFEFTGAPNGNSSLGINRTDWEGGTAKVLAENVAIDPLSFALYNKADPFVKIIPINFRLVGNTWELKFSEFELSALNRTIDPGSSQTFVIEANVTNFQVDPTKSSSLQVSLDIASLVFTDRDAVNKFTYSNMEYPETVVKSTRYGAPAPSLMAPAAIDSLFASEDLFQLAI